MNKNYADFYQNITKNIRSEEDRKKLNLANHCLTYVFYVAYPVLLLYTGIFQKGVFWKILLIPAVSFLLLSLIRAKLNAPRPYEAAAITPLIEKKKKGNSMPSRHVFSAAIIAMAYLYVFPWIGGVLLLAAAASGTIRVLGGVHFPQDVVVGYSAAVLCGILFFVL